MSGFVFYSITTNGLCDGFSHHSSCVPNGFNWSALSYRFMLFCAITNGVDIGNISF